MLDLDVLDDLIVIGFSNIQQLSTEGKDTVIVTADDSETRHRESFGRVSFRQDKSTSLGVSSTSVVGIFELDDTGNSIPN